MVIPSLPGYGFSEAPKQPGCGLAKVSQIMNELMMRLGYNQYCMCYWNDQIVSKVTHVMIQVYMVQIGVVLLANISQ